MNGRLVILALAACLASGAVAQQARPDRALQDAARHYHAGEWGVAFDKMAMLASRGHADAARIALFMHEHGPQLYGSYWPVSSEQLQRWQGLVTVQEQPVARSSVAPRARR